MRSPALHVGRRVIHSKYFELEKIKKMIPFRGGQFDISKLLHELLTICAVVFVTTTSAFGQEVTKAEDAAQTVVTATYRPLVTRLQALSQTSFLLRWQMPDGQAEGFRIYRDGELVVTLPAEAREFRDNGLRPTTTYSYQVAALMQDVEVRSPPVADITQLPNLTKRQTFATFDIVVAGSTPGGIAAALTAARLGRTVALVSPSPWLGGMMTGGLSRTDFGSMKSSGGLFKEFVDRAYAYYVATYGADSPQAKASRTGYYFEPRVAKWIFHQMLSEQPRITVMLSHYTQDVEKQGNRVTAAYVLDRPRMIRKTLTAKVFIDATYEGDLAAQSGAAYRIGREDRAEFGEEHAGELFWNPVQTKVVFGSGKGDRKVQAYNYRLILTKRPDNVYPFPYPSTYDRSRYTSLLPDIASGRVKTIHQVMSILPLPNDKFDANNHPLGNPSTDLIGGSDTYPESDLWERERIAEAHRQHILGLLYFIQNDPEVPEAFRQETRQWGLAYDEFVDNDRFPNQLYVREGRRILGPYIFTENDARSASPERRPNSHFDSIGVADYPIDSHATSPEKNGLLEGFFYLPGSQTQPSQIPYRVMTPVGIEGVLVSGCVSSTHIGYGTLRMEPVFMALGTAAGMAAHLSVQQNVVPSQLNTTKLQHDLLEQRQVIAVFHDVPLDHPQWAALQYFGTKGFFPEFEARPDATVTRAEAAQWLWNWIRLHQPNLEPVIDQARAAEDVKAYQPAYLAVRALLHWKIVDKARLFAPDEALTSATSRQWLNAAFKVLRWRTATLSTSVAPDTLLTRGDFCQQLYEVELAALKP